MTNEEREQVEAEMLELWAAAIQAAGERRSAVCLHCGASVPFGNLDHWRECKQHPALAEVEYLRGVLVMVREELVFGGDWKAARAAIDRALERAR